MSNGPAKPLTPVQVAQVARAAGFSGAALVVAVAVAGAESGWDPDNIGDELLANQPTGDGRTWGPSIGLWQIRSIKEEAGKGTLRDPTQLTNPAFNARSAFALYKGRGGDFTDWTVYTGKRKVNGRWVVGEKPYKSYLDRAKGAVSALSAVDQYSGGNLDAIENLTSDLNSIPGSAEVQALGEVVTTPITTAAQAAVEAGRILQRVAGAWNQDTAFRVVKVVGGMAALITGAFLLSRDLVGDALAQVATPAAGAVAGAVA